MKKLFIILAIFLLAPMIVQAEEKSASAILDFNVGDVSTGGNSAPYVQTGPSGYVPTPNAVIEDKQRDYDYSNTDPFIDGMTLEQLLIFSASVDNKMHFAQPIMKEVDNNDPIKLLDPGNPEDVKKMKNMYPLGKWAVESRPEQELLGLCAMLMAEAKIHTNARYGILKLRFSNEATVRGGGAGIGFIRGLSDISGGSFGAFYGKGKTRNMRISIVEFEAYGGQKYPEEAEEALVATPVEAIPESKPAPNLSPTVKSEKISNPIYFAFDIDIPLPQEEEKIKKIVMWIMQNWNDIRELEFRGYCDIRGSEDYNSQLGFRRARNVMYTVIERLLAKVPADEQTSFIAATKQLFRAVSASDLNPHFDGESETAHQKNRRVDLILNGQNLTGGVK